MKIAIIRADVRDICTNYYNNQEIGLAKALSNFGYTIDIYTPWHEDKSIRINDNICVLYKKYFKFPIVDHFLIKGMKKAIQQQDYDLVHCNDENTINSVLYSIYSRDRKFVIYHGMYRSVNSKVLKIYESLHNKIIKNIIRKNTGFIFGKTTAAVDFIRRKGYQNIHRLPVGLDTDNLLACPTKNDKRSGNKVLYVGVLEKRRNPLFIAKLAKIKKELHFTIIGSGEEEGALKDFIEQNALENITLIDNVPQRELGRYYLESDLFLLPSSHEIFGMVLLEALYFDTPVLSTPTAGAMDIVTEKVGVTCELDLAKWTTTIDDIIKNRNKFSPKKVFHNNFEWLIIAKKYIDIVSSNECLPH